MRTMWGWGLLAAAWSAVAPAAEAEVPVIENAGYAFCVGEANDAMTIGRLATVFKRSRAQIDADPVIPPYLRGIAADFFRDQAEGRASSYVHFGLHRFRDCLTVQKVRLDVDDFRLFACLTRMDIPYFFLVLKRAGEPFATATPKVEGALAGWQYPAGLVAMLAEPAWGLQSDRDTRDMQAFLLSSCLLPPEQVSNYYGIALPPDEKGGKPAAGAPARGAAGKAAAPARAPAGKEGARP